jgi:ubiquinone/menaquinone biosynthesis C-methylase UbiE
MRGVYGWLRRRLSLDRNPSQSTFWDSRARQFGIRAVYNIGHAPEELTAVDRRQKAVLFPVLRDYLTGNERAVLDLGCGVGRFSSELAEVVGAEVTAVDVSRELLALAPPNPKVRYVLSSATRVPFAGESFDVVWVCLLLGALRGELLNEAAHEIERVSKPGSLLFLVENTSAKPDGPTWAFRDAGAYLRLFPAFGLSAVTSYDDLGESISVFVGRKH